VQPRLLAGQIDLRSFSTPAVLPLMKSGKARVIGINSLKRSPLMPDVPTVDEAGLPGFESANWNRIMAPSGTPRDIIFNLHDESQRRVIKSELREQLIKDGYEIAALGPEAFAEFMKIETEKMGEGHTHHKRESGVTSKSFAADFTDERRLTLK
jgi:tripartite-type tricarboxylate transporter receptor subunit TctC